MAVSLREQPNLKLRLSPEDYEAVKNRAAANERSVAAELRFIVKQYLKKEGT